MYAKLLLNDLYLHNTNIIFHFTETCRERLSNLPKFPQLGGGLIIAYELTLQLKKNFFSFFLWL